MSAPPLVSVVMTTYNRAGMLADAVQSVRDQSGPPWELVLVDDGSTDATAAVVAAWRDPRIRYLPQPNRGLAASRHRAAAEAAAPYIAFLDSDDIFLPGKLAAQARFLDDNPAIGLVAGGHREVDAQLRPLRNVRTWELSPSLSPRDFVLGCPFVPSTVMVRREWLKRVGGFDASIFGADDWDCWLRLALAGCRMSWIPRIVTAYRVHGANMQSSSVIKMQAGMAAVLDKLFARPGLPDEILALRAEAYGKMYVAAAARAFAAAETEAGCRWLREAVTVHPPLAAGDPPPALDSLIAFATEPLAGDGPRFLERIKTALPSSLPASAWTAGRIDGLYWMIHAFRYFREAMYGDACRSALRAASRDWRWLRNRGWWSVALRGGLRSLSPSSHQPINKTRSRLPLPAAIQTRREQ